MIKYALICEFDHEFEAWFSNSAAYDSQLEAGLIECPHCQSTHIRKQIMAPRIRVTKDKSSPPRPDLMPDNIAGHIRAHIAGNFDYVGNQFATEARAIHYGEKSPRALWGEVSADEAKSLADEGVEAAPLPKPFVPPKPKTDNEIN